MPTALIVVDPQTTDDAINDVSTTSTPAVFAQSGALALRRYFNYRLVAAQCLVFVAVLSNVADAQLANSTWSDYGGGLRNTHQVSVLGPSSPTIAWTYEVGDPAQGLNTWAFHQPAIDQDGAIYFLTYPGGNAETITALNPDGSHRWSTNGVTSASRVGFWPAVDNQNRVFYMSGAASSDSARLVGRNTNSGSVSWLGEIIQRSNPFQTGPTVALDGTIYWGDDKQHLVSSAQNTQTNWIASGSGPYVNPAIAADGTVITGGVALSAFSPAGALLWSVPALSGSGKASVFTSAAIDSHGNIFAGTSSSALNGRFVVALDPTGNELWVRDGFGGAPAVGPDGTIYAGYQGVLHAMDPVDGHDLWTYSTGAIDEFGAEGVTIDGAGNIYVSTVQGNLISLSASGTLRWSLDLAPDLGRDIYLSAPVIGNNGMLYVGGGYTGKFFAIQNVPEPASIYLAGIAIAVFLLHARGHSRRRLQPMEQVARAY